MSLAFYVTGLLSGKKHMIWEADLASGKRARTLCGVRITNWDRYLVGADTADGAESTCRRCSRALLLRALKER